MKLTEEQFDKIINTVWALLESDPPPKKETTKYAIEQILTPAPPPRSAEKRPIVIFGEPLRFKSIDERIMDEIHNSEEPTIRSAEEDPFAAMEIVNQLFDLAEVPVDMRQSINDRADEYVIDRLHAYALQFRHEVTDEEIFNEAWKRVYEEEIENFIQGAKWMREKITGK